MRGGTWGGHGVPGYARGGGVPPQSTAMPSSSSASPSPMAANVSSMLSLLHVALFLKALPCPSVTILHHSSMSASEVPTSPSVMQPNTYGGSTLLRRRPLISSADAFATFDPSAASSEPSSPSVSTMKHGMGRNSPLLATLSLCSTRCSMHFFIAYFISVCPPALRDSTFSANASSVRSGHILNLSLKGTSVLMSPSLVWFLIISTNDRLHVLSLDPAMEPLMSRQNTKIFWLGLITSAS
mmetsp:Transcript_54211/g.152684  ORF Transcript_54211/g.152684 Transcript_54211/m.152684 type:complete len:240 (+) Transcript_54211:54-773(+)